MTRYGWMTYTSQASESVSSTVSAGMLTSVGVSIAATAALGAAVAWLQRRGPEADEV